MLHPLPQVLGQPDGLPLLGHVADRDLRTALDSRSGARARPPASSPHIPRGERL